MLACDAATILVKLARQEFFGEVVLTFVKGQITTVRTSQNLKAPDEEVITIQLVRGEPRKPDGGGER